jgi:protein TonB
MKRVLPITVTIVAMVGILFVPLNTTEEEKAIKSPQQQMVTITLSTALHAQNEEQVPTLSTPQLPLEVKDNVDPVVSELHEDVEVAEDPVIQEHLPPVLMHSDLLIEQAQEIVFHELEDSITPPVFDLTRLVSALEYPPIARRQNKEGVVLLRLFVTEDGRIENIVVKNDPGYGFAEAAIRAFHTLQPIPAKRGDQPIAVTLVYPIRFLLKP